MANRKRKPKGKVSGIRTRFGEKMRRLRNQRKWSQVYMAVHTGLSRTFISDVENALKEPCLTSIETVANAFGMTVSQFMNGIDNGSSAGKSVYKNKRTKLISGDPLH